MSPLWRKLAADVRLERGRMVLTVAALALSLAGLGTMVNAHAVLIREINLNYRATRPAVATFDVGRVDASLVTEISQLTGVTAVERRGALDARVRDGADWRPLRLFIVDDFNDLRLNTFTSATGAWPPPAGTLLLERTAVRLAALKLGDNLAVRTPHGEVRSMKISGLVHDAGLAPSEQEQTLFGYVTEETLRELGEPGGFEEVRIGLDPRFADRASITAKCREIAAWLASRGYTVHEIKIPPPGRHPHQGPMEAVLLSFIGFGGLALLLSAVLMATTMTSLLAKQVRQIAILKAIGGSPGKIALVYGTMALAVGIVATTIAVPMGVAVARPFAAQISDLINFTISSPDVPTAKLLLQVGIGLLVPLMAAAGPICRSVNLPVREGLADQGVRTTAGLRRRETAPSFWFVILPRLTLAWRNSLRRRLRFALTLGLLATGAAVLMSAFNLRTAWQRMIDRVYTERSYDVSLQLRASESGGVIDEVLRTVPGVLRYEAWQSLPTSFQVPGEVPVSATYPDGAHGSFTLYAVPPDTKMIAFPVREGRWLRADDTDSVVLNHAARRRLSVGDRVSLSVGDGAREWTVVGFVEEVGSSAAAYVPLPAWDDHGRTNLLRIETSAAIGHDKLEIIRQIEQSLEQRGLRVTMGVPLAELQTAMGAHVAVLLSTLVAAALVMGTVAALGLSAMMGMSVIERTREIGMLRAIGTTPREIALLIMMEAQAMGLVGLLLAIPLSVGVSTLLGKIVGMTAFLIPLAPTFSWLGLGVCLVGLIVLIAAAAGLPARTAARLSIRTALDYT